MDLANWHHIQLLLAFVQGKNTYITYIYGIQYNISSLLLKLIWFIHSSTDNMFAVAIVNSDFKTAESDILLDIDDSLLSNGLDLLSEVSFVIYVFKHY